MNLLDIIVQYIPVSYLPEQLIRTYLPGDTCLNHCDTMDIVFTMSYTKKLKDLVEFPGLGVKYWMHMTYTFMDESCRVLHSFHGNPSVEETNCFETDLQWHRNGKIYHIRNGDGSMEDRKMNINF